MSTAIVRGTISSATRTSSDAKPERSRLRMSNLRGEFFRLIDDAQADAWRLDGGERFDFLHRVAHRAFGRPVRRDHDGHKFAFMRFALQHGAEADVMQA